MKLRKPIVAEKYFKWKNNLTGRNAVGWFFFPFIFINRKEPHPIDNANWIKWHKTVNHESMHYWQCVELLVIGFSIIYFGHFFWNYIKYGNYSEAYRNVVYEREAYHNQYDLKYLETRKLFSFMEYFNDEKYEWKKKIK
jgi:hypothetical protein